MPKPTDTTMPEVVRGSSRLTQRFGPSEGKHKLLAAQVAETIVVGVQVLLFPVMEQAEVVIVLVVEQV
jgi:hypothetical protein